MEKFEELSFEETSDFSGGFILTGIGIAESFREISFGFYSACVEFVEGIKEGFEDGKKLK